MRVVAPIANIGIMPSPADRRRRGRLVWWRRHYSQPDRLVLQVVLGRIRYNYRLASWLERAVVKFVWHTRVATNAKMAAASNKHSSYLTNPSVQTVDSFFGSQNYPLSYSHACPQGYKHTYPHDKILFNLN